MAGSGGRYYVYVVRCGDGSLYTGIATDVVRRIAEHLGERGAGARYTRAHPPVGLAMCWSTEGGRAAASRLECRIKRLARADKESLIARPALANSLGACEAGERAFRTVARPTRERWWDEARARAGRRG